MNCPILLLLVSELYLKKNLNLKRGWPSVGSIVYNVAAKPLEAKRRSHKLINSACLLAIEKASS
jgi:hypothetical protein